eukprot:COSAG06_NODE_8249_length_2223_cov_32.678295_2_plen_147_part_00
MRVQFLGQSVSFEFPFFYNYSAAFTCEGDSVPYYQLLQRVRKKCPRLREVKVNMEMFVERLNNGLHVRTTMRLADVLGQLAQITPTLTHDAMLVCHDCLPAYLPGCLPCLACLVACLPGWLAAWPADWLGWLPGLPCRARTTVRIS